jgi:hypothetical protein
MADFTTQSLVTCTKWEEKQVEKILGGWERKMGIALKEAHSKPTSQISNKQLTVQYPKPQHSKVANKTCVTSSMKSLEILLYCTKTNKTQTATDCL